MKSLHVSLILLVLLSTANAQNGYPDTDIVEYKEPTQAVEENQIWNNQNLVTITVMGQGVAPAFAKSPAQSYALAKRAATADAYRLLAERVKGVQINANDTIKDMAIKSSTVNTQVQALIRNATIVETQFKDGLCQVEMEIKLNKNNFQ